MDPTQDQDEGMIGPTLFKYSIKYQPTQDGIRVFLSGHGDNLQELADEMALFYPQYLEDMKTKRGMKIAPFERPPKVVASTTRAPTKAEKIAELDTVAKGAEQ